MFLVKFNLIPNISNNIIIILRVLIIEYYKYKNISFVEKFYLFIIYYIESFFYKFSKNIFRNKKTIIVIKYINYLKK